MAPAYTFLGPDRNGTVYFKHSKSNKVPVFSVSNFGKKKPQVLIYRIVPNGQRVPCADATYSSLSGSVVVNIDGRQTKLKQSWEGMTIKKEFASPINGNKLQWKYGGWGNKQDLYDSTLGKKLVRVHPKSSKDGGLPKTEIYVTAESVMIDQLLVISMVMYRQDKKDSSHLEVASDVVGGVLDAVGAVDGGSGGDGGGGGGGGDGGGGGGGA